MPVEFVAAELKNTLLAPHIAEGSHVGQVKCEAKLIVVAHRAKSEAAEFEDDAAAIKIVIRLEGSVLEKTGELVEADGSGDIDAAAVDVAITGQNSELVKARGRRGCQDSIDQGRLGRNLQVKIAGPEVDSAETVVEEYVARVNGAMFGVVLQIPLDVGGQSHVLNPEAGNDGRGVSRLSQERDAGKLHSGSQHVGLTGDDGAAEGRIEKVFLRDFPSGDLTSLRGGGTGEHRVGFFLFLTRAAEINVLVGHAGKRGDTRSQAAPGNVRGGAFGVETSDEAVLHLVGIAQHVAIVKTHKAVEIVYPGHVAVNHARLDDVLELLAEDFTLKDLFEGGRTKLEAALESFAVDGIIGSDANPGAIFHQALGVCSIADSDLGAQSPAMEEFRQGGTRLDIETADRTSGLKRGLVPGNAFEGSLESPVERGIADFAVHARGLKAGQMKDGNFIAGGEAEEILITGAHDVERITITGAGGEADGLNLRGNRGGVKLVPGESE